MADQINDRLVDLDDLLALSPDAGHADRTVAGGIAAVELLDALVNNRVERAQKVLDGCDPMPTIFALASAWITLAQFTEFDIEDLLRQMRSTNEVPNGGRRG
ncbi:hypothetical protein [Nocardia aurea]|uniref:hypothetical protein n=1 Tax=Nocardia aurea TaxID=2144174 RepID=UPI0033B1C96B